MKRSLLAVLALFVLVLQSCQKEPTDPDMQPGNNPGGSYLPLGKNTFWKYEDSASGAFTTMLVLGNTKSINGRLYTAVLGSNATQTDTFYMAHVGADYFNYADVSTGSGSAVILFHYLNDTASIGRSWEYAAGQGNGFPATFQTTVMERNLTYTVKGKMYSNVIHTRMELFYDIAGSRMHAGTYHYYIAKDIGIVQTRSDLGLLGNTFSAVSNLVAYDVK